MTETPKQIAARIRRGDYRPIFTETRKRPGDVIISGGKVAA